MTMDILGEASKAMKQSVQEMNVTAKIGIPAIRFWGPQARLEALNLSVSGCARV